MNLKLKEVFNGKVVNMAAGEKMTFSFDIKAQFPARAEGTASQAYSYYNPDLRGETMTGGSVPRALAALGISSPG